MSPAADLFVRAESRARGAAPNISFFGCFGESLAADLPAAPSAQGAAAARRSKNKFWAQSQK
jgi:hypothetical protein